MAKGFFISCAIDYPNAKLHMGHLYEKTLADVIARIHRLNGEKVLFSVGVDEHGENIQNLTNKEGIRPQLYVDKMAIESMKLFDKSLISYDKFVRTSSIEHKKSSQFFIQKLFDAGDIYFSTFEGWYCLSDETFWLERDLATNGDVKCCPNEHCGKPVQKVKEPSYFFKWSKFQDPLLNWYRTYKKNVFPEFRKNEMISFMNNGLRDISFSRKSVQWGVPIPFDEEYTIYVWGDALVNYLTVCGYPSVNFLDYWPADIHVVGVDINRFHSLLWPAMLMSAGVPLPKQILVHGFINDKNGEKMSKSKGNVVDPVQLIEKYGVEPIRYYLLRETPIGNDISFSESNLIERNNSELANGLGNLINRVLSMLEKYCDGRIPKPHGKKFTISKSDEVVNDSLNYFLSHDIQLGLIKIWELVALGNKAIADLEPWKIIDSGGRNDVESLLAAEVELIRKISILIYPVLPISSESICEQFGFSRPSFSEIQKKSKMGGRQIKKGKLLFTKISTN